MFIPLRMNIYPHKLWYEKLYVVPLKEWEKDHKPRLPVTTLNKKSYGYFKLHNVQDENNNEGNFFSYDNYEFINKFWWDKHNKLIIKDIHILDA